MYSEIISLFNNTAYNNKDFFYLKKSNEYINFLNLLLKEGLIKNYKIITDLNYSNNIIKVFLIRKGNNKLLIKRIKLISKTSKSVYIRSKNIKLKIGINFIILTCNGLMIDFKSKKLNLGGKVICNIIY